MTAAYFYHSPILPWSVSEEEELRFKRILKRSFLIFLVFALVLPWLPVPEIPREKAEELPPRLAQLLLEKQTPPPPPVEQKLERPEAKPKEVKKVEPKKVEPEKPAKSVEAARAKAEKSGLLAFKDELADLRSASINDKLSKPDLAKGPSKGAGPGGPARNSERSLVTSGATSGSGGINTARLSRDTGGGGLGGHATGTMTSPMGGGGGGTVARGGSGKAARSLEELRLVFERNKGAIYSIYNRALREDPSLQGKVVLKLTIASSGQVLDVQIISSELKAPELERKLLARIKQFDFGAKNVDTLVVTYPLDFLPS